MSSTIDQPQATSDGSDGDPTKVRTPDKNGTTASNGASSALVAASPLVSAVESGWVPDMLTRFGIRQLLKKRLRDLDSNGSSVREFLQQRRSEPIAVETQQANEQHYEVPADFFKLVLGTNLKYSSGFWEPGETSLDRAEDEALRQTVERALIEDMVYTK